MRFVGSPQNLESFHTICLVIHFGVESLCSTTPPASFDSGRLYMLYIINSVNSTAL